MNKKLIGFLAIIILIISLLLLMPAIYQPASYINFADQRSFNWRIYTIPNFLDTLTNIPYTIFGLIGLCYFYTHKNLNFVKAEKILILISLLGFVLTGFASSYFHLQLTPFSLFIDRLGMSIIFIGLIGLIINYNFSINYTLITLPIISIFIILSNYYWLITNNIAPWSLAQTLGIIIILGHCFKKNNHRIFINFIWIIGLYLISKLFEFGDEFFYKLTFETISGHSLKHLISAFAALPIIWYLITLHKCQNTQKL